MNQQASTVHELHAAGAMASHGSGAGVSSAREVDEVAQNWGEEQVRATQQSMQVCVRAGAEGSRSLLGAVGSRRWEAQECQLQEAVARLRTSSRSSRTAVHQAMDPRP